MSITAKDYCVSLEMAQRAELHAAMEAAGCEVPDWAWRHWHDDEEVAEGAQPNWELLRATDDDEVGAWPWLYHDEGYDWPAYHFGELWCAAMHFAAEGNGVMLQHRAQPRTLAEPVMAKSGDTGGEFATSAHAPDALAELVIALHKGAAQ